MLTKEDLKDIDRLNELAVELLGFLNDTYHQQVPLYPHNIEKAYKEFNQIVNRLKILDLDQIKIDYVATIKGSKYD